MSLSSKPTNKSVNLKTLHRSISDCFDLSELKTLCLGRSIDIETLSGSNKNDKIRELITHVIRRGELPGLLADLREERPNQSWPSVDDLPQNKHFPFINGLGDVSGCFFQFGTVGAVGLFLAPGLLLGVIYFIYLLTTASQSGTQVTIHTVGESGEALANAKVLLFYQGAPLSQFTDSNGVAVFSVASDHKAAHIIIEHEAYKIYEQQIPLLQNQSFDVQLEPKAADNQNTLVRVIDDSTNNPIEGAHVLLIVAGQIFEDDTDVNGLSSFILGQLRQTVDVELQVTTEAYETSFKTVTLQPDRVQDVRLNPRTQEIVGIYEPESTTIAGLIEKEAEAVLTQNFALVADIFAPEAIKIYAVTGETWNARDRYATTFELEDHLEIIHTNMDIEIQGNRAVATNDTCGVFIDVNNQRFTYSGPKSDRWEFTQDENGRWWITSLTFGLVPPAEHFTYGFEEGSPGCWSVRLDNNVPQGHPPSFTDDLVYEGNGALHFSFNLAETSAHRAQIKYENMPFAGSFSAYVYTPPDAPHNLIASFYAMEFAQDPWNYHGIDTGEGQIVELIPGEWTEVRWIGDVAGWPSPVHLLGIEIRQQSEGSYNGYVLVDNIVINGR
ncbi:MAG: hypothetical protein IT327_14555 [Anaerolineae bacterium]|nr:hypothetical protein [Anaerolineae bacterium]